MAFTVTARHTGSSGTSSAQTHTSNSTTPTADSLFFAVWGSENDASSTAQSFQTPTGGGLTYSQVAVAGVSPSYPWNGDDSFRVGLAAYRAAVGGSPSAFAITVDSSSTTATFFYGEIGFDVTGHDAVTPIVNSAIAGGTKAAGNSETGTVTIGWTPAVGNLVIVCFTSGADGGGGFASPTAGAGKTFTTITNQTTASCQVGAFYRVWDGTESLTVTCSDLGDTVGNYGAIVFEVASGSGAPAPADAGLWVPQSRGIVMPQSPLYFPFTTPWAGQDITGATFPVDQTDDAGLTDANIIEITKSVTQTDSAGLTDALVIDQTKGFTDQTGLTDTAALTVSPNFTDSAGLTDTSLVELSKLVAQTDSTGLTDSVLLTQGKAFTDSVGLADAAEFMQSKILTDSAGLTDASLVESGKALGQTDSIGLTDSQAFSQTHVLTDSTGLTDTAGLTVSKLFTDTAGLTDATAVGLQRDVTQTDSTGLTDAAVLFRTAVLTDLVGLADATAFSQLRILTDSAGLTDAADIGSGIPGTTPRPNTGTTGRPTSGITPRPNSGITARP